MAIDDQVREYVSCEVSQDKLSVHLRIDGKFKPNYPLRIADVIHLLKEKNIKHGIEHEIIEFTVNSTTVR